MDFVSAWGFGSFILNRPSAPVFGGGFIVKTDAENDAGDAELRGSRDLGAGCLCPFVCKYLDYCLVSARIKQSAWVQLSLTPEVGARWCGEPFPASSVRSNKAF